MPQDHIITQASEEKPPHYIDCSNTTRGTARLSLNLLVQSQAVPTKGHFLQNVELWMAISQRICTKMEYMYHQNLNGIETPYSGPEQKEDKEGC